MDLSFVNCEWRVNTIKPYHLLLFEPTCMMTSTKCCVKILYYISIIRGGGINWPHLNFKKKKKDIYTNIHMCIYIYALTLVILFYKIIFYPFNNIFDFFRVTLQLQTYLQHFYILLRYKFLVRIWAITYITFLLINNHSLYQQYTFSIFLIVKAIKKIYRSKI